MSEEQLIVTIGAKDSASTIIGKVNSQLKYLDKEYNLAMKSSDGFDKSMDGLGTTLKSLQSKYEANSIKLKAYKDQFDKASDSVKKKEVEIKKLTQAEGDNSAAIAKAEEQLSKYKTQMSNAAKNINLTELEMKNLDKQIATTSNSINNFKMDQFNKKMEEMTTKMNTYGDRLKTFGAGMSTAGTGLMKVSAPIIALGAASVKAAIDFETAFAGVRKTVNGTEEDFAKLKKGIKDMSEKMPQSATQIAAVAEAAGQLGVKKENILEFTKTMVMLGDSSNMSSDQAATALARLANITQMPQDKFQNLGSVIVELGNNMATTESEITEMGLRLAGAGKQVGLSEAQTLGLAAALSSVGVEAEAGGSAFSKVMVSMQLAAETGTKANEVIAQTGLTLRELQLMSSLDGDSFKGIASGLSLTTGELRNLMSASSDLEAFAKVTGKTTEEFKKGFKEDAAGSIVSFITGLQECESQGISAIAVLDEMGITEVRLRDSLLRAAGAGDVFSNAIQMGSDAWESNTALTTEAGKRYETTASKIAMLKNRATELGIEIGEDLMPYIVEIMEEISNLINWFGGLDKSTQQAIIKTGMLTFTLGGLMKIFGPLVSGMGSTLKVGGNLVKWLATTQKASAGASLALKGIGATATATAGSGGVLAASLGTLGSAAITLGPSLLLVGGAYVALKAQAELSNSSILKSTDNMSILEKTLNNLGGGFHKSEEELVAMGIKYSEFNEGVSGDFKQALINSSDEIRDFNLALHETTLDGVITTEETTALVSRVDNMCKESLAIIQSYEDPGKQAMLKAFSADGIISDSEQKTLDVYGKTFDKAKEVVIQKTEENKNLLLERTDENYKEIDAKIQQNEVAIGRATLDIQATNAEDQKAMLTNYIERIQNIDEAGASEILIQKKQAMEEQNTTVHDKYDEGIELLKEQIGKSTGETKKGYEQQYEHLISARQRELTANRENFNQYYTELEVNNRKIAENISITTGEILSEEQTKSQHRLIGLKETYAGMNAITESGYYQMYNTTTGTMDNVAVKIDESTGQIAGVFSATTGECGESMNGMMVKAQELASDTEVKSASMANNWQFLSSSAVNSSNQIIGKNGEVASSLENITTNADGTRQGIINLNGQSIQVKVDSNGAIYALDSIMDKMRTISGSAVTIEMRQNWVSDGRGGVYVPGGYASGTTNATRGVHLVGEDGPELMYFNGGETVIPADKTKDIITSGGYFNPTSQESRSLSNTINNYSNTNYSGSSSNSGIDGAALASQIANAVASAISGISLTMDKERVGNIVNNVNGTTGAIERRLNGWSGK